MIFHCNHCGESLAEDPMQVVGDGFHKDYLSEVVVHTFETDGAGNRVVVYYCDLECFVEEATAD